MDFKFITPPSQLQRYVRYFWTIDCNNISDKDNTFKVFARRFPRIVFQHHNGNSAIYKGSRKLPLAYVSGLNSEPYVCGIKPSFTTTGISFYPHAIKALFGVDTSGIVDELPDLINFVPRCVIDKVVEAKSQEEKISILVDFLIKLVSNIKKEDARSEFAWRFISNSMDFAVLRDLQNLFNVSERQLIRIFNTTIGMTPNQFLRITRFEKAVQLIQYFKTPKLLDITYQLKYADQSHFIREFKEFSHHTPSAYIKQHKLYEENSAIMIK